MNFGFLGWKFKKYQYPAIVKWIDFNIMQYIWQIVVVLLWLASYTLMVTQNTNATGFCIFLVASMMTIIWSIISFVSKDDGLCYQHSRYGENFYSRRSMLWMIIAAVFIVIPAILVIIYN